MEVRQIGFFFSKLYRSINFIGHPKPTLVWWFNDTILDSVVDSNRGSATTVNQLLITSIGRQFKNGKLECRASSSSEAPDVVREVPLTLYCKLC